MVYRANDEDWILSLGFHLRIFNVSSVRSYFLDLALPIITSADEIGEVMFYIAFVCLFVCLSVCFVYLFVQTITQKR